MSSNADIKRLSANPISLVMPTKVAASPHTSKISVTGPRAMSPSRRNAGLALRRGQPYSARPVGLQPRGSTKELIKHYESIHSTGFSHARFNLPASRFSKDKTGHLRESFRNLLSVFKKAKLPSKPRDKSPSQEASSASNGTNAIPPYPKASAEKHTPRFDTSVLHYSSPLLYLSRPPSSDTSASRILPVWTPCTAQLRNDHIVLTWLTAHGNPFTHTIPLVSCTDVHSLALGELRPEEKALLPSMSQSKEHQIFEIAFHGKPLEKFSANTLQERAEWVTAIWCEI